MGTTEMTDLTQRLHAYARAAAQDGCVSGDWAKEAAERIEALEGLCSEVYQIVGDLAAKAGASMACQEVRSLNAHIRDNRDAADRIRCLLRAVEASRSHDSGETPQAAGGA